MYVSLYPLWSWDAPPSPHPLPANPLSAQSFKSMQKVWSVPLGHKRRLKHLSQQTHANILQVTDLVNYNNPS